MAGNGPKVALQLAEDRGHRFVEHRLEDVERAAHLVLDMGPRAADLVGLPPDRQHLAQLVEQHTAA